MSFVINRSLTERFMFRLEEAYSNFLLTAFRHLFVFFPTSNPKATNTQLLNTMRYQIPKLSYPHMSARIQNYDFHLALLSLSARNAVQNRLTLDVYSSF
jgi:hypothetical protein